MQENLETKLLEYAKSDTYAFHMPGHKRIMDPLGGEAIKLDITEIDGFDNLHDAEGVLRDEMKSAAEMYGVKETLFSVNGSTCALLSAISAAVPKGGTILIERTCHMAVYHAAYLRELNVLYVEDICPQRAERSVSGGPVCDREPYSGAIRAALDSNAAFDALVITSPTYEGCIKDVASWAAFAHARGAVLIVDEAHGAHLGFHPYFPESAVRCGADVVVQSTHKTLPAMTQTALLHNVSGRVTSRRLQFFMDIYETSSPSYVLMASVTGALRLVREQGRELFENYARRLAKVRRELCTLKHFRLAGGTDAVIGPGDEVLPYPAGTRMDPGKLVLMPVRQTDIKANAEPRNALTDAKCIYGADWLYDVLRDEYHLQMEMRTAEYCLAMTSFADTDEGIGRLARAMREIDERVDRELSDLKAQREKFPSREIQPVPETDEAATDRSERDTAVRKVDVVSRKDRRNYMKLSNVPNTGSESEAQRNVHGIFMKLSEALDAGSESVALEDAAGRVCADFVILYPPDVPLIVPGEIYTAEKISEIRGFIDRGLSVIGVR